MRASTKPANGVYSAAEYSSSRRGVSVEIFQNYYQDGQQRRLDPAFQPNDGRRNANTHYRELGLFLRLYHSGLHGAADYTGIVSPRFGEKTGKTGQEFIDFVRNNPGHDVYFINPFPQNAYYSFNVWMHGELCHSGLIGLAQRFFRKANIDFDITRMGRNSASTLLYSNYWAGNQRFWDGFMDLNIRLMNTLETLPPELRKAYFEIDPRYPGKVPILPFIFERLFSTFLLMRPDIKALAYRHHRYELVSAAAKNPDEHAILLAFMHLIDEIDARGEYNAKDMAVFHSVLRMKQNLDRR
jgi:hypothetical protein